MQSKNCTKCHKEKPISEFHKSSSRGKFGVRSECKECLKSSRTKRKEQVPKGFKLCSKCDKEKPLDEFYKSNKSNDKLSSECKVCFYNCYHIQALKRTRKYYNFYKDDILKKSKIYNINHKNEKREYDKKYRIKNKSTINLKRRIKTKTNISFKLSNNLRARIIKILNGINKSAPTMKLLGCDINFFRQHLESQFKNGMNWNNHGKGDNGKGMKEWHIDHIYPCASFNLKKKSEQKICFHWSNQQPMWAKENWIKSDK